MNRKLMAALIASGSVITLAATAVFVLSFGAFDYTRRCAHIADKQGIVCEVGDTLYIDDLAYFSNYDDRMITGITDGEGEISDDKTSVTITKASGFVRIYVYAHNKNAPERTEHGIRVMIKDQ